MFNCPNCGSNEVAHLGEKKYFCKSCDTQFVCENQNEHIIINANRKDYCPICGIDNTDSLTYKCMNCGNENICVKHMVDIYDDDVKINTLCLDCFRESFTCEKCGTKTTCYYEEDDQKRYVDVSKMNFICDKCGMVLCKDCAERRGIIFPTYHCPECGTEL